MEIVRSAMRHTGRVAVKLSNGSAYSYGKLLECSEALQSDLSRLLPGGPKPSSSLPPASSSVSSGRDGPRVGIYAEPGLQYIAATWATWLAGGIAVPLAVTHPRHELDYVIRDAGISAVLTSPAGHDKLKDACHEARAALHTMDDVLLAGPDRHLAPPDSSPAGSGGISTGLEHTRNHSRTTTITTSELGASGALMVYTSGTTGRPKGALHTHGSLAAQADCLTRAWAWAPSDCILHCLPLHHIHGIVNALYCPLAVGAAVHFLPRFSPAAAWQALMSGNISVFMAVPTMYSHLLSHAESAMAPQEQAAAAAAAAGLRLAVSGSAAAPVPLLQRWRELSGQQLLERYGMTETGMILSNPYSGERRAGFVGLPLPGVEAKVLPLSGDDAASSSRSSSRSDGASDAGSSSSSTSPALAVGELAVRGPMLFREYWGRPAATADSFDAEGFFLTGDTVSLEGSPPSYRILGRSSVDIIKSGGFKISALDIESSLLHHPGVAEAAVVGVPDEAMGELVAALVYPKQQGDAGSSGSSSSSAGAELLAQLKELCSAELAAYAVPRRWQLLDAPLPRNAMGKVNKKELLAQFFPAEAVAAAMTGAAPATAAAPLAQ